MSKFWQPRITVFAGLSHKAQVRRIASSTGLSCHAVVGCLLEVWLAAQSKATEGGLLEGKSLTWIDLIVVQPGFAESMVQAGWLEITADGPRITNFDEFISKKAVKRIESAGRMAGKRESGSTAKSAGMTNIPQHTATQSNKLLPGQTVTTVRPGKKSQAKQPAQPCPLFETFWAAYPWQSRRPRAEEQWRKLTVTEELLGCMIAALERQKGSDQWTKENGRYIPLPGNWLRDRGWEDRPPEAGRPVRGDPRIKSGTGGFTAGRSYSTDAPPPSGTKPDHGRGRQASLFD